MRLPGKPTAQFPILRRTIILDRTDRDSRVVDETRSKTVDAAVSEPKRALDAIRPIAIRPQPQVPVATLDPGFLALAFAGDRQFIPRLPDRLRADTGVSEALGDGLITEPRRGSAIGWL
jgi:hypothetical protein